MPYENPQGRRVNAVAALIADGPQPSLTWATERGSLLAEQILDFLGTIPRPAGEQLVVVLDNGSTHTSRIVKDALPQLRTRGIDLYYLPPYSPNLNAIERAFGVIKHHEMPERRYTTWESLEAAIDTAFTNYETHLQHPKALRQPRPPA